MARKPPLKLRATPAASDDDGAALAKRLESSRKLYRPETSSVETPGDDTIAEQSGKPIEEIGSSIPAAERSNQETKAETTRVERAVSHYTILVSVPDDVDRRTRERADKLGYSLDYLRKAVMAKAKEAVLGRPKSWTPKQRQRFRDLINSGREKRVQWGRMTITLGTEQLQALRKEAGDELEIHPPTTVVSAAIRSLAELTEL